MPTQCNAEQLSFHTWTPLLMQSVSFGFGSQEEIAAIHPACVCDTRPRALMEYAG